MQRHVLAPPHPHPHLQPVQAVQPPHALLVHPPALPSQQDVNAQIPEPRPRHRQLANAEPEGGLIPRRAPPIPRGSCQPREPTRPGDRDLERLLDPARPLSPPGRRHRFFRIVSIRMCLSSVRSATTRFRRASAPPAPRKTWTAASCPTPLVRWWIAKRTYSSFKVLAISGRTSKEKAARDAVR